MESSAWLLNFGDGQLAAVGKRELLHLVPLQGLFDVPRAPRHCSRVMLWQHHVVPVFDMLAWLGVGSGASDAGLVAVVGYQSRRRQIPQFGALLLAEPPARIVVSDAQACELSPQQSAWDKLAISCFRHEENPVAVLDLPLMFSRAFATSVST